MNQSDQHVLVVYVEAESPGGVTGVIEETVRSCADSFRVGIVLRDTPRLKEWATRVIPPSVQLLPVALRNYGDIAGWIDLFNLLRVEKIFRHANLVHFHLHTPFSCLPAMFTARVVGVKSTVSTEHYITQLRHLRRRKLPILLHLVRELRIRLLMALKKRSLRFLDRIVTVSEANRALLLSVFGESLAGKVVTIPNGIDVAKFKCATENKKVNLHELGIRFAKVASHVVAVVAGLNNQKGHEYLIRAAPSVLQQVPDVAFLLVGDGHLRPHLESLVARLGLTDHVVFTGNRSDVPEILAAADLFVLPSLFEGMPLSVLEAMAAGKAVVATNVDGTAEVVEDGVTGFLVPAKDSEQLAEKIVRLLRDNSLRQEFGRQGRERVQTHFRREQMVSAYVKLYSEFL